MLNAFDDIPDGIRPAVPAVAANGPNGFRPPAPEPRQGSMGPFALLKAMRENPIGIWSQAHFEEPIVLGGFAFGRVAVVSEPQAVRKVLVDDAANYRKSAMQTRVLSVALRNGLLTVEGDRWRRQRRTLAPLLAKRMVMSFAPAMAKAVGAMIERWRARGEDHVFDLGSEMNRLTLDGLIHTFFSDGLGDNAEAMRVAMMTYFAVAGRIDPFDIMGLPDFVPRLTRWKVRPMLRFFDRAVDEIIATRRRKLADAPDEAPRDMLTALLDVRDPVTGERMDDTEVKANIITFIAAGQETTANALTWALYLVANSPEWCERLEAEAEADIDDWTDGLADSFVDTRALVDEALRLYPPITAIARTAGRRDELAGRTIEAGTMVVVSPYVLHRHRRLWDNPDLFDPTRFLPGAARRVERYAFLPFGSGPRTCLGAVFAHQEATIVLASLLKNLELRLLPGQSVWPMQGITLRPRDPLLMTVKARHS
ncbi:MAG TPA: cytochrome P450 [Xanthobacteraceae bacterium]|nr:cytochrome P450 [Xanthobacteraceae bacterium]